MKNTARGSGFPIIALVIIGVFMIGFFAIFSFLAPSILENAANEVESLTPSSVVRLGDEEPGTKILVQGRISDRNTVLFESSVAYTREELETDMDDEEEWVERERVTPPLLLELPDGLVSVVNDNYDIEMTTTIERGSDTRYHVIQRGDPAIAVGTLIADSDPPRMEAEFVARGTREGYISSQRTSAKIMRFVGMVFGVVGLGMMLLSVWLWLRRRAS